MRVPHSTQNVHCSVLPLSVGRLHGLTLPCKRANASAGTITEIPNADGTLKPKMTGYAKIKIEHRPVWDVLFRPFLRWLRIEVWSWLP